MSVVSWLDVFCCSRKGPWSDRLTNPSPLTSPGAMKCARSEDMATVPASVGSGLLGKGFTTGGSVGSGLTQVANWTTGGHHLY